jgi:signal transduction histidine kinase
MQERKWFSFDGWLPLEERGSFKYMISGLLTLVVGMILLYGGNRYIEYLSARLTERSFEIAICGAAFCIFVHGCQVFSLILGWTMIGQGAGAYSKRWGVCVNIAVSSAGMLATWKVLPMFSEYLRVASLLDVVFVAMLNALFQLATLNIEKGVDKGVAMLLWVCSFQSLELLPTFPSYRSSFPIPFFESGYYSQKETVVAVLTGTTLFLSFTMGAALSTWVLAKYSIRLTQVRRLWGYTSLQAHEGEELRHVSMVDMRNLVHDLKNPLAAVKGMAMMLHTEMGGSGAPQKTEVMLKAISYMEHMIAEILHEEQREMMPVEPFFEHFEQNIRPFPWGKEVILSVDPDARGSRFSINKIRLMRALFDILDNAWRANRMTGTKGLGLCVRLNARFLEIEVLDNGPGYVPRRSTQRSGWGSTGLGLAFARRVVAAHGGELVIAPRANANGASVLISLPAVVPCACTDAATDSMSRFFERTAIQEQVSYGQKDRAYDAGERQNVQITLE